MGAEVGLVRPVLEISDEQTDCQHSLVKSRRKQYFPPRRSILSQKGHQPGRHPQRAPILHLGQAEEQSDMRIPQLLSGALGAVMILAAGCNRTDASRNAREAATEVRGAAAEAGDRLADGWLTTKVQAQYFADRDIKARYINVSARDGIVTLKGYVASERFGDVLQSRAPPRRGARERRAVVGVAPDKETFEPAGSARPAATSTTPQLPPVPRPRADRRSGHQHGQARFYLDPVMKTRCIDVQTRGGVVTLRARWPTNERARRDPGAADERRQPVEIAVTVPSPDPAWRP